MSTNPQEEKKCAGCAICLNRLDVPTGDICVKKHECECHSSPTTESWRERYNELDYCDDAHCLDEEKILNFIETELSRTKADAQKEVVEDILKLMFPRGIDNPDIDMSSYGWIITRIEAYARSKGINLPE